MCKKGGKTKLNGNRSVLGEDGFVVQCVGPWAKDKHDYLERYVEATAGPRSKYLSNQGGRPAGGAAFVDLFAGPGMARVRTSGEIISGSPLIAVRHARAPFTQIVLCDKEPENADALRKRTAGYGTVHVLEGDCNHRIEDILNLIPEYGLNIALLDPYGLRPLSFETISALGRVKRMDLLIHFPTMDIKRNLQNKSQLQYIDQFLGTKDWRSRVKSPGDVVKLIDVLREQLAPVGYDQKAVRSLPVLNRNKNVLYHLIYASKHVKGNAIWESIAKTTATGQQSFSI